MPLHDPGMVSLTASRGAIRLGRSLALPESCKAVSSTGFLFHLPFLVPVFAPPPDHPLQIPTSSRARVSAPTIVQESRI
jgi:hypothetical protein